MRAGDEHVRHSIFFLRRHAGAAFAASVIARASSTVRANGFSHMMCLPALAAAIALQPAKARENKEAAAAIVLNDAAKNDASF